MKFFEDNFEPVEVTMKNVKGEQFTLQSVFLDAEAIKEIESLTKSRKELEMDKVYKILLKIFGKGESFFKQFSINLLVNVTKYVIEESKKNSASAGG